MIFSTQSAEDSSSRRKRRVSDAVALVLTLAATGAMMLCPCDVVGMHDHQALALVGIAIAFGIAAAAVLYRRMGRTSETTGFLRAVIAVAAVGLGIFVELFLAQEVVALMARRQ